MNEPKQQESRVVVPFTGYLHHSPPTETSPQKQTTTPYITIAALLFVAGLALGAISVNSSTESQMKELNVKVETQAKQLSTIKKTVCN
ncbi:hypothetical protein CAL7716_034820 [Calothrix sp. PCC 7716]|nr:hypothetical protein CAL7716_034820 [Calothrix sp. PCC 7716]